ncbi:MAG: citrate lyase subunit alpha, partial [Acholeplasmataceae bacterium]|nr:citrate lyase subunit alpha [Acholeplasmataceae bacterium]
ISDLYYAKHKVVVTDFLTNDLLIKEIDGTYVDYVVKVDKIGNSQGIVSGTTKPTKDPVQLKIAKDTIKIMDALGLIKQGMSFQTGAGGTSIAVADLLRKKMIDKNIKGSFASGGITSYLVKMYEEGLFEELYDVQCFDLDAIRSYKENPKHHPMSASKYANPCHESVLVNQLDVVILGATEIDLDFNVNVTTDSHGYLMGGSGGHSDTAYGAKVSIITSNLIKSRTPIIKESVTALTTPGSTVDIFVTERGIAVNPKRKDLIDLLKKSSFPIITIEELYQKAIDITGKPKPLEKSDKIIGLIRYRDGSIIDTLYQVRK